MSLGPEKGETEKMLEKLRLKDLSPIQEEIVRNLAIEYIDIMEYDKEKPNLVPNIEH